jgi:hypothetical protein
MARPDFSLLAVDCGLGITLFANANMNILSQTNVTAQRGFLAAQH